MEIEVRYRLGQRATWIAAIANTLLAILKIVVGVFAGSPALWSDGIHSFADVLCDFLVILAIRFGHRAADQNHPYGHQRFETLATLSLGVFLIGIGFAIAWEALGNVIHGRAIVPGISAFWVALVSIGVNEWLFRYQVRISKQINSNLIEANAWHSRGDALASIVVLVGIAGGLAGFPKLDSLAALFVAAIILRMGFRWSWKALYELSDAGIDESLLRSIKEVISGVDGVLHMHQLRSRQMADKIVLDVHVEIAPYATASEGHYIAESVRWILLKQFPSILDVTVHVDVDEDQDGDVVVIPKSRQALLSLLEPKWASILPLNQIERVAIYYIQQKIELSLYVNPLYCLSSVSVSALQNSIQDLPEIRCLKVFQEFRELV